uniref:Uncharacterized protein n=1 Tax=Anguilla anguilla TaxID=7936 RepID=A0A0E9QYP1_ANGAN
MIIAFCIILQHVTRLSPIITAYISQSNYQGFS